MNNFEFTKLELVRKQELLEKRLENVKKRVESEEKSFDDRLENFKVFLENRMKVFCDVVGCEMKLLQNQRRNTRQWVKEELLKIQAEFESSVFIEENDQGCSVEVKNEKEFVAVSSSSEEEEVNEGDSEVSVSCSSVYSPVSENSDIN